MQNHQQHVRNFKYKETATQEITHTKANTKLKNKVNIKRTYQ